LLFFGFTPGDRLVAPSGGAVDPHTPRSPARPEPVEVQVVPRDDDEAPPVRSHPDAAIPPSTPDYPDPNPPPDRIPMTWTPGPEGPVTPGLKAIPPVIGIPGPEQDPGRRVLGLVDLDSVPRVKFRVPPEYPYAARSAGLAGEVWVEFTVDETGRVISPRVVRSTDPQFEAATLRAVARWVFESGRRKGTPVRFRMSIPVVFSIGDGS
jgi:protein TonB